MAKAKETYFAAVDITVEGAPYKIGDKIKTDVPDGCLASMKRLGQAVTEKPEEDPGGLKDQKERQKAAKAEAKAKAEAEAKSKAEAEAKAKADDK